MKFKVTEHSTASSNAKFSVHTECGKHVESFSTDGEAQKKAAELNDEYERISELL